MAMTLEERLRLRALEEQCGDMHKRLDALHGLVQASIADIDRQMKLVLSQAVAGQDDAARTTDRESAIALEVQLAEIRIEVANELAALTRERQKESVARVYHRKEMRTLAGGLAFLIVLVAAFGKVRVTLESVVGMASALAALFGVMWHLIEQCHGEERRVKEAVGILVTEAKPEKAAT